MNKEEKIQFVTELANNIANGIIVVIETDQIPEDWDGIELRWLFEERAMARFGKELKKRKQEYNNTVIVNNL